MKVTSPVVITGKVFPEPECDFLQTKLNMIQVKMMPWTRRQLGRYLCMEVIRVYPQYMGTQVHNTWDPALNQEEVEIQLQVSKSQWYVLTSGLLGILQKGTFILQELSHIVFPPPPQFFRTQLQERFHSCYIGGLSSSPSLYILLLTYMGLPTPVVSKDLFIRFLIFP